MPSISVCLSPGLVHLHDLTNKIAVVVDILRATTTISTALKSGAIAIRPVETLDQCEFWMAKGYLGAAERGGKKVDGFRYGNSPFDYLNEKISGEKIALTTTNGTKTIYAVKEAEMIVMGAFVNISSLLKVLLDNNKDILIVCAGWNDEINLEDTLFAGAVVERLKDSFEIINDPAILAHNLYLQGKDNMFNFLEKSSHVSRLLNFGLKKDIEFCLETDRFEQVSVMRNDEIISLTY